MGATFSASGLHRPASTVMAPRQRPVAYVAWAAADGQLPAPAGGPRGGLRRQGPMGLGEHVSTVHAMLMETSGPWPPYQNPLAAPLAAPRSLLSSTRSLPYGQGSQQAPAPTGDRPLPKEFLPSWSAHSCTGCLGLCPPAPGPAALPLRTIRHHVTLCVPGSSPSRCTRQLYVRQLTTHLEQLLRLIVQRAQLHGVPGPLPTFVAPGELGRCSP